MTQNMYARFRDILSSRDLRDDLPRIVAIIAAVVFIDHVFEIGVMTIDWIGIGLLVLIGFAPYISHLRKLAVGEFEVELGSEIESEKIERLDQQTNQYSYLEGKYENRSDEIEDFAIAEDQDQTANSKMLDKLSAIYSEVRCEF